jgi:hypothetical protein
MATSVANLRDSYRILVEMSEEKIQLGNLNLDGSIIVKCIPKEYDKIM